MSPETAFAIINTIILPPWLLLWFAPRWRVTDWVAHGVLYPVLLGLTYVGIIAYTLIAGVGSDEVSFLTLEGVTAIFSHPWGLVVAWAHFLVFDLFVGAWEGRDARRRGIAHWKVAPCQFLTFMAGPLGLLCYLGLRKRWHLSGASAGSAASP